MRWGVTKRTREYQDFLLQHQLRQLAKIEDKKIYYGIYYGTNKKGLSRKRLTL